MTLGILAVALAAAAPPTIVVPRSATPVVIDARLDTIEWADAAQVPWPDGHTLRLQHDGKYLYLALESPRSGFVSLCHAAADSVRVLHSSAALGSVRYGPSGQTWASRDTAFVYAMRNSDTSDAARQERRAYLAQHGWVASTLTMGQGLRHEMQIALEQLGRTPRIAVAFFALGAADSWSIQRWPPDLTEQEGCSNAQLVRGFVPHGLRFDPSTWAELRL